MTARAGLEQPAAVIFDWDSTLVDNWGAIERALNATLGKMGKPTWSREEVHRRTKKSARDRFPALFGERWEEALDFFYARFEEFHLQEVRALPGAAGLLETLRDHDIVISLVSNKTGRYLRAEAEHLGWAPYFANMIGAADAPRDKPEPDPVHMALAGTGVVAGGNVWFVGDSVVDLKCAHLAACVPLLVEGGSITPEELAEWPPRAIFPSCGTLAAAFMDCAGAR